MAGIYIHIPFCRQACYYCNFHFSTVLSYKERVVQAIAKELFLRKDELANQKIESIYFGGGTPSLLSEKEFNIISNTLHKYYHLSEVKEFTLEANPDDLSEPFLKFLANSEVNRLSIGIQSFEDKHLKMMNRAHNASEARDSVQKAINIGIQNISIDLIYGIPGMDLTTWKNNISLALDLGVSHISSYCLTIEPKTVFGKQKEKQKLLLPSDEDTEKQFFQLIQQTAEAGFEQYEISNFAKKGAYALHNTNYWKGIPYLGVGPGAHSFFPGERMWNISNNQYYLKAIELGELPIEKEMLSINNQFNEMVMTGLRTQWGINLREIESTFGSGYLKALKKNLKPFLANGKVKEENQIITLSLEGKFFADGIAAAAFVTD